MILKRFWVILILAGCVSGASHRHLLYQQSVTLYPPNDKATGKYDEGRACLSFNPGVRKQDANNHWDVGYGFAAINDEDWFILHTSNENRTAIKDLGELSWSNMFKVPMLEPLPMLPKGERRKVTVDSSGDTGKRWARTTNMMAKVVTGHMYLMRIKDEERDFYVMFRVEEFEQGSYCTITWRLIPSPEN